MASPNTIGSQPQIARHCAVGKLGLLHSNAPVSRFLTQIRIRLRKMSCAFRKTVQRVAGDEFLGDLSFEMAVRQSA